MNKVVPITTQPQIPGITFGKVTGVDELPVASRKKLPKAAKQKVKLKAGAPISTALNAKGGRLTRKKKVL